MIHSTSILHNVTCLWCRGVSPGGGGGGVTLIFSSDVGSGPASTVHSQKYQEFQALQDKFEISPTPKNILHYVP